MNLFIIIRAKKRVRRLYQMMKQQSFDELPINILSESDKEITFRHHNLEGKILKLEEGYALYTLFDIYHKGKLIKGAYHIYLERKRTNSEMKEFSRSGVSVPGPC